MSADSDLPNVIVFFTDQQRWDSTGVHGNPLGLTPNFDRLASAGTHISHAFTPQPVCAPARSALQTGQYPTRTGVFRNRIALPSTVPTLARQFAAAGYDTGYVGKWHLAATGTDPVPVDRRGGYEHWLASDVVERMSGPYDARLHDSAGRLVRLPGYRADAYVDAAIRYIAEDRRRPFYLFVSLLEPHHQNDCDDYLAPIGYRERYERAWQPRDLEALGGSSAEQIAGYWGTVKRVDEAFGRLLDALESLALRDRTVVAFTSDHGCHFKTRNDEYKRSAHDASIRVPMALDGPGFRGGGRIDDLVSLIDLPPTLLDAAGLAVPEQMQGHSLLARRRGELAEWPGEVFVQISESQVGRAIRTHRWKYAVVAPQADPWNESGSLSYVEDALYDLDADPSELTNLIDSPTHREVADELGLRLIRRMVDAGEAAPTIEIRPTTDARAGRPFDEATS